MIDGTTGFDKVLFEEGAEATKRDDDGQRETAMIEIGRKSLLVFSADFKGLLSRTDGETAVLSLEAPQPIFV